MTLFVQTCSLSLVYYSIKKNCGIPFYEVRDSICEMRDWDEVKDSLWESGNIPCVCVCVCVLCCKYIGLTYHAILGMLCWSCWKWRHLHGAETFPFYIRPPGIVWTLQGRQSGRRNSAISRSKVKFWNMKASHSLDHTQPLFCANVMVPLYYFLNFTATCE